MDILPLWKFIVFHRNLPLSDRPSLGFSVALAGLVGGVLATAAWGGDWTKFQAGPASDTSVTAIPIEWSPEQAAKWVATLPGYGQSSPVTWKDRVFLTAISGSNKEKCHVVAVDRESGKIVWEHVTDAASQGENSRYISRAAPSPVVDELGVHCFFEGGNLLSLTHDGQPRWSRNLVTEFGEIQARHGLSASLEADGSRLYVWVERSADPYILAVDKATGRDVWKSAGVGATSWASPRLLPVGDKTHLMLSGIGSVIGLDPATGERLWRVEGISGNSSPTPVPAGNGKFLVGATAGRGEPGGGKAAESNGLVVVRESEPGKFAAEFVWRAKRATCSFGSPLAAGKEAYFVNASGVLFCLDLETGDELYTQRLADSVWATPFAVGDHLYFFGKGGTVSIVKSGREFALVAESKTWDDIPATPPAAAEGNAGGDRPAAAPKAREGRASGTGSSENSGGRAGGPGAGRPGAGGPEGPASPTLYAAIVSDRDLFLRRGDRLYRIRGE